jgi:hypothetical protein
MKTASVVLLCLRNGTVAILRIGVEFGGSSGEYRQFKWHNFCLFSELLLIKRSFHMNPTAEIK